jgi:hypothetical protein
VLAVARCAQVITIEKGDGHVSPRLVLDHRHGRDDVSDDAVDNYTRGNEQMKRIHTVVIFAFAAFFALAAWAGQTKLFDKYEGVRQALLKGSVADVQRTATELAGAAEAERQSAIAGRARELSAVASLKGVRDSFAMLSEQMIRFRDSQAGDRPVVVYCSMEKRSWLQPKGAIVNPYLDGSMRSCGEVRKDQAAPSPSPHGHHH